MLLEMMMTGSSSDTIPHAPGAGDTRQIYNGAGQKGTDDRGEDSRDKLEASLPILKNKDM